MIALLVKILGTAHGIFALWTLLVIPALLKSETMNHLSLVQASIKLTASLLGAAFLLLCMWTSWQLSPSSGVYAWLALGTFLLAAFSDTVALQGPAALFGLMPTFYKAVAIRTLAATLLTALSFSVSSNAGGG